MLHSCGHLEPIHTALKRVTPPEVEPVTLAQAKSSARVDGTAEDSDITAMIIEARKDLEEMTARAFITQGCRLTMDRFPRVPIELRVCPVQADSCEITYIDVAGETQTVDPDTYKLDTDSEPARIHLLPGYAWPVTDGQIGAVTVTFNAGYGDAAGDVPENVKRAIKLLVGDRFRHRDATSNRKGSDELFQKLVRLLGWGAWP